MIPCSMEESLTFELSGMAGPAGVQQELPLQEGQWCGVAAAGSGAAFRV